MPVDLNRTPFQDHPGTKDRKSKNLADASGNLLVLVIRCPFASPRVVSPVKDDLQRIGPVDKYWAAIANPCIIRRNEMEMHLAGVETGMQQNKSKSFYDPLVYPGKLTAQLIYLYGVAGGGGFGGAVNARPTDASYERFEKLQMEANELLQRLQVIFDTDVEAFNRLLRELDLQPVVVKQEKREVIP